VRVSSAGDRFARMEDRRLAGRRARENSGGSASTGVQRGILDDVTFPAKQTFDSSRAPRRGEKRARIELGARSNLIELRARLSTVEADVAANNPAALKAQIARLTAGLKKAQQNIPGIEPKAIEAAERAAWMAGAAAMREAFLVGADTLSEAVAALKSVPTPAFKMPAPRLGAVATVAARQIPARSPSSAPNIRGIADSLSRPQRKVLDSLAFWRSVSHEAPSRAQVAAVAGYSVGSGGFGNLIGTLHTAGLIDIPAPGHVALTDGGRALTNGAMSIAEARNFILSVLSGPQRKLVEAAIGGGEITRDELATRTNYSASSGGFGNLVGSLCALAIFTKPRNGVVALSDWAMEVLGTANR
jgi:hypothetical protein